ncbi:sensor histidine kinase [Roseateles toxinivorans]|uniref:histidine kinase n=1 Tax=Roseateles toxinivorans TaxID=270368 RepID=A0A4R6QT86_9BURK|nr:sensor histidine kinase [Roseateles toxinivorans]TDP74774.1 two-component system sensor histidine kinase TctE [Roseateles toxinivorans]
MSAVASGVSAGLRRLPLRTRLLSALGLSLTLVLGAALLLDLRGAERLADQAFDQALLNTATALAARLEIDTDNDLEADLPVSAQALLQADPLDRLYIAIFDGPGKLVWGDARLAPHAGAGSDSLSTAGSASLDQQPVRVLVLRRQGPGQRGVIVVAETLNKRGDARAQMQMRSLRLGLAMLVAALLGLYLSTRSVLAPLERFTRNITGRAHRDLRPFEVEQSGAEVAALAQALNLLMARLRDSAHAQQAFIGDAAHQLRTPIAALSLQLEMAMQDHATTPNGPAHDQFLQRLQTMQVLVARLQHMVQRVLSLSRSSSEAGSNQAPATVDLADVAEACAGLFVDRARQAGIDLGFELLPAVVVGWEDELQELLSNLIDNALSHGGGRVTVRTRDLAPGALLEVEDEGPGFDADLAATVFERHRRGPDSSGAGLGLSIARAIAEHHGAQLTLQARDDGTGAVARLVFGPPLKT